MVIVPWWIPRWERRKPKGHRYLFVGQSALEKLKRLFIHVQMHGSFNLDSNPMFFSGCFYRLLMLPNHKELWKAIPKMFKLGCWNLALGTQVIFAKQVEKKI